MASVYINNSVIHFTGQAPAESEEKNFLLNNPTPARMKELVSEVLKSPLTAYLISANPDSLLKTFESFFTILEAAGGVVRNSGGELLFIYRNGKWDLPKGKLEPGESRKSAAVREVEEECGISGVKPAGEICTTRHVYELRGKQMLKKTVWFDMRYDGNEKLIPQNEEGITRAEWVVKKNISELLKNTYPSILEVLEKSR